MTHLAIIFANKKQIFLHINLRLLWSGDLDLEEIGEASQTWTGDLDLEGIGEAHLTPTGDLEVATERCWTSEGNLTGDLTLEGGLEGDGETDLDEDPLTTACGDWISELS